MRERSFIHGHLARWNLAQKMKQKKFTHKEKKFKHSHTTQQKLSTHPLPSHTWICHFTSLPKVASTPMGSMNSEKIMRRGVSLMASPPLVGGELNGGELPLAPQGVLGFWYLLGGKKWGTASPKVIPTPSSAFHTGWKTLHGIFHWNLSFIAPKTSS